MHNERLLDNDMYYLGVSDRRLALFENIYPIENGVSYNSYLIKDNKTILFDTIDRSVGLQFFENLKSALGDRKLDYLVIHHMEPDHASMLEELILRYPEVKIVANSKIKDMIKQFFDLDITNRFIEVKDGDTLETEHHSLTFVFAPMVHWPEVMVSYDAATGTLFSADAFGTFGALSGNIYADQYDFEREFLDEARRYYFNIVGKYGLQAMNLLRKASNLPIKRICPLHGPIWRDEEGIKWFVEKYIKWASYQSEEKSVLFVYGSIYGNTEAAANVLASMVSIRGVRDLKMYDVSKTDKSIILSDCFKYSTVVFLSATYNLEIFTPMQNLIEDLKEHLFQNKNVAIIENGSWALQAGKKMKESFSLMKNINLLKEPISIKSSLKDVQLVELEDLADKLVESVK